METENTQHKKGVSAFYVFLGRKIKEARLNRGYAPNELADLLSITYQQMHRYELGLSRIPVERLCSLARRLDMPIEDFLNDIPLSANESDIVVSFPESSMRTAELISSFNQLPAHKRRAILLLVEAAALQQIESTTT